jgi:hypothetical protein
MKLRGTLLLLSLTISGNRLKFWKDMIMTLFLITLFVQKNNSFRSVVFAPEISAIYETLSRNSNGSKAEDFLGCRLRPNAVRDPRRRDPPKPDCHALVAANALPRPKPGWLLRSGAARITEHSLQSDAAAGF